MKRPANRTRKKPVTAPTAVFSSGSAPPIRPPISLVTRVRSCSSTAAPDSPSVPDIDEMLFLEPVLHAIHGRRQLLLDHRELLTQRRPRQHEEADHEGRDQDQHQGADSARLMPALVQRLHEDGQERRDEQREERDEQDIACQPEQVGQRPEPDDDEGGLRHELQAERSGRPRFFCALCHDVPAARSGGRGSGSHGPCQRPRRAMDAGRAAR
jgi:hypothetical protein